MVNLWYDVTDVTTFQSGVVPNSDMSSSEGTDHHIDLEQARHGKGEKAKLFALPRLSPDFLRHRSGRKRAWALLTVCLILAGVISLFFARPSACRDVPECMDALELGFNHCDSTPRSRAAALGMLLAKEVSLLMATRREFQNNRLSEFGFDDPTHALAVMSMVIFVLLITESAMALGFTVAHAVPPWPGLLEDWGGVITLRYMEWMISVPLLIILCGHYLLARPMHEVVAPVLITNAYMYIAWLALVIQGNSLRIVLVVASFAGYFWASILMLKWVWQFLREVPPDVPRRALRICLLVGIVILFGVYGVIYLLAMTGVIAPATEHEFYARCDFMCKLTMSFALGNVREAERCLQLLGLVVEFGDLNVSYLSVLRGHFDHVMHCSCDAECKLLVDIHPTDTAALEDVLGREVGGCVFNDLIATPEEVTRFKEYVQMTLFKIPYETESIISDSSKENRSMSLANVFVCHLADNKLGTASEDPAENKHRAFIYLSVAARRSSGASHERHMVLALNVKEGQQAGGRARRRSKSLHSRNFKKSASVSSRFTTYALRSDERRTSESSRGGNSRSRTPSKSSIATTAATTAKSMDVPHDSVACGEDEDASEDPCSLDMPSSAKPHAMDCKDPDSPASSIGLTLKLLPGDAPNEVAEDFAVGA